MRVRSLSLIYFALFCAFLSPTAARANAGIGDAAPAFIAKTLDGKPFDLSTLRGKVVVINFWATWCPPCRWEMPALEVVWRQYHTKGLVMLAVSADLSRGKSAVVDVMHYFSFPAAIMDGVSKNELVTVSSVPVTYVIGKDGKVEDIFSVPLKPLTAMELDAKVKALLDVKYEDKTEKKAESKSDAKPEAKTEAPLPDITPVKPDTQPEENPENKKDVKL